MDWKSIAGLILPHAPKIGTVLGLAFGGPGGAAIGGAAGTAISAVAAALGVAPTPEAVKTAIATGGSEAIEKLRILEATRGEAIRQEALVEIERLKSQAEQSKAINETIRVEAAVVPWWHWRHLLGYVTVAFGTVLVAGYAKFSFFGGDIASYTQLVAQGSIIFATLAGLNGWIASDNTNRMNTAITGEHSAGGVINTLRTALVRK